MAGGGGHLAERSDDLAVLDDALQAAAAGSGAIALVEGSPGIGKTELLTAAKARAARQGMSVLSARGEELERSFPYGVERQLFERAVTEAHGVTREGLLCGAAHHARTIVDPRAQPHSTVDRSAVLHGLYWLTANLADDRPGDAITESAPEKIRSRPRRERRPRRRDSINRCRVAQG